MDSVPAPELELEPEPELELEPEPELKQPSSKPEGRMHAFNRSYEVPLQRYAAVVIVRDVETADVQQPIFKVLQAFDTHADADGYVRNCAATTIRDHDIAVIPMYTWVSTTSKDAAATVYRDNSLHKLIHANREQQARLQAYKSTGELPDETDEVD